MKAARTYGPFLATLMSLLSGCASGPPEDSQLVWVGPIPPNTVSVVIASVGDHGLKELPFYRYKHAAGWWTDASEGWPIQGLDVEGEYFRVQWRPARKYVVLLRNVHRQWSACWFASQNVLLDTADLEGMGSVRRFKLNQCDATGPIGQTVLHHLGVRYGLAQPLVDRLLPTEDRRRSDLCIRAEWPFYFRRLERASDLARNGKAEEAFREILVLMEGLDSDIAHLSWSDEEAEALERAYAAFEKLRDAVESKNPQQSVKAIEALRGSMELWSRGR